MTDRSAEERLRTAVHESGHAAMSYTLRRPVSVASIRPSEHFAGVVVHSPTSIRDQNLDLIGFGPVVLQPTRVRTSLEKRVLFLLAGSAAELIYAERLQGYVATPPDEQEAAREVQRFVNAPSVREMRDLKEAEERDDVESDEERAAWWSRVLAGEAGTAYLHYLRIETDRIVRSVTFGKLVGALVPVLMEREIVSGRAVRKLFDEVSGRSQPPLEIAAASTN